MPQHQVIGIVLIALAIVDTAVGHFLVAPRVTDEAKRNMLKVAFSASGAGLAGLGYAFYRGLIPL